MSLDLGELNAIIDADDRGFNKTIDRAHDRMSRLRKNTGFLTGMLRVLGRSTAFAALATGAAGATSAIAPLLGLVSTLGTAVVGLGAAVPAFAAGGVAAIGTLVLAFQGLGDAIAGDEEALERLTPAAREFVGVLEDIKPAWEGIQRSVQQEFFEHLSGTFERVAGNVLPRLEAGLTHVAGGLGEVAAAALDAADMPQVLTGMNEVLQSTGDGLSAMAEGVGGWMRGLGILMSEFAPLLERAGIGAANLGEQFGEWIQQAQQAGRIQDLIESMLDTLSLLASLVGNLGSIFGSVFGAANEAGGGLLGTLEDLTGQLADFLSSAEGQDALQSFFTSAAELGSILIPIVMAVVEAFALHLAPIISDIATSVGPSLVGVAEGIGDALSRIDIKPLADGFADLLDIITPLLGPVGEILNFLIQLAPVIIPVASAIAIIIGALKAWQAILVVVTIAQWAWNAALYANPIVWIIGLIVALIAIVVLLVMHWDTVTAAISASWEFLQEKASAIWGGITSWISEKTAAAQATLNAIWSEISDFFSGIWDDITSSVEGGVNRVRAFIGWFSELPGKVSEWFGGVKDSAVEKLQGLVAWVNGLPDRILGAIGDLGSLLWDAGRDILQGLLDGIQSMWSSVQSKFSELTNMIPDIKGPADKDKRLLTPAGEMIMGGLVDGIDRGIPAVRRLLEDLTTDIGLQVDAAAAPRTAAAPMRLDEDDRRLLVGAGARPAGDTQQTFNIYDAQQDPGTLAYEMEWLARRRP